MNKAQSIEIFCIKEIKSSLINAKLCNLTEIKQKFRPKITGEGEPQEPTHQAP